MKANIFQMMTLYNIVLIAVYFVLQKPPKWFHSFIASLSLIIFAGYVVAIAVYGYFVVPMYTIVFQRVFGRSFSPPKWFIVVVDIIVHVLPVIIFGLPSEFSSYIIACLFVATWYSVIRTQVNDIYLTPYTSMYKRDIIVYVGLSVSCVIAYALAKKGYLYFPKHAQA